MINTFWFGFAVGILIMSALGFIGGYASDHDKMGLLAFCLGPFVWTSNIVCFIIWRIQHWITYSNRCALLVCPDNKIRYCKPNKAEYFINIIEGYKFADYTTYYEQESWDRKDWGKEFCNTSDTANVRYAPRKVWKHYENIKNYIKTK